MRENTRNTKKFDVLFNENVSYGFRRNLLGLKLSGFLLNAFIAIVCLCIFWRRWPVDLSNGFDAKLLAVILIAILHAVYLALFVTRRPDRAGNADHRNGDRKTPNRSNR